MGKDNPRKDEYIETAARLFLEKGYNETSVRDILDAAGDSSPSVLYYYFKSKKDKMCGRVIFVFLLRRCATPCKRCLYI